MSCSLNSLTADHLGDYIGFRLWGLGSKLLTWELNRGLSREYNEGDIRRLDHRSYW